MQAEIYALYSTRDGRVRYVGQSGDRTLRFKEHLRSAETWPNGCPLNKWFQHEWRHGYPVRYALVDVCDYNTRHAAETNWIWRFPRSDLLNRHKRRPWWLSEPKPPVIPEIVGYRRQRIFNVGGFRGVHYDRHEGHYRVLRYNGYRVYWLQGDELPGGSASIWFSDLARALNARDAKEPHRALMEARRRADIIVSQAREE
jgi:hypothetical protein